MLAVAKGWKILAILVGLSPLRANAEAAKPSASALLQDAERARGASKDGMSWEMALESLENGVTTKARYFVQVKGADALITTLEPEKKKGEIFLVKKDSMLFIKPGLKRPVATSNRQKLMGNTSNGDLATINLSEDYNSTLVGEEKITGTEAWVLDLKAKTKHVTYDGIKLWISKSDHQIIKADYLNVSGTVMKSAIAEYRNTLSLQGKSIPFVSAMTVSSAQNSADKTIITYFTPKEEKLADSIFTLKPAGGQK